MLRSMGVSRLFGACLALAALGAEPVSACSCEDPFATHVGTVTTVANADGVFLARALGAPVAVADFVDSSLMHWPMQSQTVEVVRAGKGPASGTQVVLTMPRSSCEFVLSTEVPSLVVMRDQDGFARVDACSGSRSVGQDSASTAFIDKVLGLAAGVAVLGSPVNGPVPGVRAIPALRPAAGSEGGGITVDGKACPSKVEKVSRRHAEQGRGL